MSSGMYGMAFVAACMNGHLEIAQWVHQRQHTTFGNIIYGDALSMTCEHGHLAVLQWLYPVYINSGFVNRHDLMAFLKSACEHGRIKVAQWLYQAYIDTGHKIDIPPEIFKRVCKNRHFPIVFWLMDVNPRYEIVHEIDNWSCKILTHAELEKKMNMTRRMPGLYLGSEHSDPNIINKLPPGVDTMVTSYLG